MKMKYPKVVILGKPNVGKSTLFNKLCGRKLAIVTDIAGTTRDRKEYLVNFDNFNFILIDTAGWENERSPLKSSMMAQTLQGIQEADLLIFMVDAKNYLSTYDLEFAKLIRKSNKKALLVANKSESKLTLTTNELIHLGLGEPLYISAEHSLGFSSLLQEIEAKLKSFKNINQVYPESEQDNLLLAIVGRPNAGKSTIFNQLIGFERNVTDAEAGTTRDAVTYNIHFNNHIISLIDTAGLRKKNKVHEKIEKLSTMQTITAIRRAHVVALVIDATQGVEQQDLAIARMTINEGKGLFLIFNKHDLIKDKKKLQTDIDYLFEHLLTDIVNVPVLHINALAGININTIMSIALKIKQNWQTNIITSKLNQWLKQSVNNYPPSFSNDKRAIKLKYITQVKTKPPTFKVFVNTPNGLSKHYERYLNHNLQRGFNLFGIPIRMVFASTKNPYVVSNTINKIL